MQIAVVRDRIAAAAARVSRDPATITLMAVSKTVEPGRIRDAYAAGLKMFGENRVQEFAEKNSALADLPDAQWRLIGHLQTNKAKRAAELSMLKYCSVSETLRRAGCDLTWEVKLI